MAEQDYQSEEEVIQVSEDYGFKANLRQKLMDLVRRIEFLEKIGIPYSITVRSMLIFAFTFAILFVVGFFTLSGNFTRAKFIAIPLILLLLLILGIVAQMCLIMPSQGSLFNNGMTFLNQIFKRIMVATGRMHVPRRTFIHDIREDGVILFTNGDFGVLYELDGMTSATAYPSEIRKQENTAMDYHNGRKVTTAEIHITSSQKQNTERQIKNLEINMNSTRDPSIHAILELDRRYLKGHVNGVKSTVVQYILFRNPDENELEESLERFEYFESSRDMYYSVRRMDKSESEELLGDIYALK